MAVASRVLLTETKTLFRRVDYFLNAWIKRLYPEPREAAIYRKSFLKSDGDTYLKMMAHNTKVIVDNLK